MRQADGPQPAGWRGPGRRFAASRYLSLLQDRDGGIWAPRPVQPVAGRTVAYLHHRRRTGSASVDVIFRTAMGAGSAPVTYRGGLTRFDGRTWEAIDTDGALTHASVNDIMQDNRGAIWVSTGYARRGGATPVGGEWTSLTTEDGLAGERVRSIFETSQAVVVCVRVRRVASSGNRGCRSPRQGLAGWEVKDSR